MTRESITVKLVEKIWLPLLCYQGDENVQIFSSVTPILAFKRSES